MRAATDMLGQKVTDKQAKKLKPIVQGVHNYSPNGVKMKLKSQTNLNMTRSYKSIIELEYYGRTLEVTVDRDELIMQLKIEGK